MTELNNQLSKTGAKVSDITIEGRPYCACSLPLGQIIIFEWVENGSKLSTEQQKFKENLESIGVKYYRCCAFVMAKEYLQREFNAARTKEEVIKSAKSYYVANQILDRCNFTDDDAEGFQDAERLLIDACSFLK